MRGVGQVAARARVRIRRPVWLAGVKRSCRVQTALRRRVRAAPAARIPMRSSWPACGHGARDLRQGHELHVGRPDRLDPSPARSREQGRRYRSEDGGNGERESSAHGFSFWCFVRGRATPLWPAPNGFVIKTVAPRRLRTRRARGPHAASSETPRGNEPQRPALRRCVRGRTATRRGLRRALRRARRPEIDARVRRGESARAPGRPLATRSALRR